MKEGWNGLALGDALRAESARISSDLPLGVTLNKITDQAVDLPPLSVPVTMRVGDRG